ncbi:GPI transamidase subunit PIG-U [Striga asiatica]|uniref:GPI transamidase subunit PIG-U n=1 Tax=Striga asiatica TaxID=4170 RepID=A0A5A7QQ36_STRAF|nr:GPI transamidase subunit PIG-U [Striga asiatica]
MVVFIGYVKDFKEGKENVGKDNENILKFLKSKNVDAKVGSSYDFSKKMSRSTWRLLIYNKINNFIWRSWHGFVATNVKLKAKGGGEDGGSFKDWCGEECCVDTFTNLKDRIWLSTSPLWWLWKTKNSWVFENTWIKDESVVDIARCEWLAFLKVKADDEVREVVADVIRTKVDSIREVDGETIKLFVRATTKKEGLLNCEFAAMLNSELVIDNVVSRDFLRDSVEAWLVKCNGTEWTWHGCKSVVKMLNKGLQDGIAGDVYGNDFRINLQYVDINRKAKKGREEGTWIKGFFCLNDLKFPHAYSSYDTERCRYLEINLSIAYD